MSNKKNNFIVKPNGTMQGKIQVPGDKSISHRAVIFGSIAKGITTVDNFLMGEDCLATIQAFRAMGVNIEIGECDKVIVHGAGLHGFKKPVQPLDLGNSGTSIRLLTGLLAGAQFDTELTGDASLLKRPMARVVEPLKQMGAKIDMQQNGTAPLHIYGGQSLHGISYTLPVASAQLKSALLLAGLYAQGETHIIEPAISRDHSERMLMAFQYKLDQKGNGICIKGGGKLIGCHIDVPADISSAAFFMVGASIALQSDIVLQHVGINPTRIGIINILRLMGADIEILNKNDQRAEPVADIRVRYAKLQGIDIPIDQVPLAIDEFPAIFVAAACANGTTRLRGAKELRVKESDRISAMAQGLQKLGINVEALPDGIVIEGGQLTGGRVNSYGDHRIAMAFAIAGLRAKDEIVIEDCTNVATSFPDFVLLANKAGLTVNLTGE